MRQSLSAIRHVFQQEWSGADGIYHLYLFLSPPCIAQLRRVIQSGVRLWLNPEPRTGSESCPPWWGEKGQTHRDSSPTRLALNSWSSPSLPTHVFRLVLSFTLRAGTSVSDVTGLWFYQVAVPSRRSIEAPFGSPQRRHVHRVSNRTGERLENRPGQNLAQFNWGLTLLRVSN